MSLEDGRIASSQLFYLIAGVIVGSSLIITPAKMAGRDSWLAVSLGLAEAIAYALIWLALAARFRRRSFASFNEAVYGRILGKIVTSGLLLFLFFEASLTVNDLTDFFTTTILPQTPSVVLSAILVLVCASAVRNGIEVISRCGQVLVPLMVITVLTTVVLLLNKIQLDRFVPLFEITPATLLGQAHAAAMFPFGIAVVLLFLTPYVNDVGDTPTSAIKAILFSGLILILSVARDTAVLGPTDAMHAFSSYQALRLINVGRFLTRVEIIGTGNLMVMVFLKLSVLYYAVSLGSAQVLGLRTYRPIVLPIGVFLVAVSVLNFPKGVGGSNMFTYEVFPVMALPFVVGIPLLTFFLALIRKIPRGREKR